MCDGSGGNPCSRWMVRKSGAAPAKKLAPAQIVDNQLLLGNNLS